MKRREFIALLAATAAVSPFGLVRSEIALQPLVRGRAHMGPPS